MADLRTAPNLGSATAMAANRAVDRRVTIGLPVHNGGGSLGLVLDNLLAQSHDDIEILICDNASNDQTSEIGQEYSAREPKVRYVRRDAPVTALRNWELAYREATTPFFMWAPDDHLHSENFVESLVAALEAEPRAGLAFGQVVKFRDYESYMEQGVPYPYQCSTLGVPIWKRLVMDKNGPFSPYGLFRTSTLKSYRWYDHSVSPDWPLMIYILLLTEIVQTTDAIFYYQEGVRPIPHPQERARRQVYTEMEKYPTFRLSWRCALAARDAARERGSTRVLPFDFALVFGGLLWANRRHLVRWALKRY